MTAWPSFLRKKSPEELARELEKTAQQADERLQEVMKESGAEEPPPMETPLEREARWRKVESDYLLEELKKTMAAKERPIPDESGKWKKLR